MIIDEFTKEKLEENPKKYPKNPPKIPKSTQNPPKLPKSPKIKKCNNSQGFENINFPTLHFRGRNPSTDCFDRTPYENPKSWVTLLPLLHMIIDEFTKEKLEENLTISSNNGGDYHVC